MDAEGLKEICEPLGAVTVKRLFSGHGIYQDGLCFAIHIRGELYFKGDADAKARYEAVGSPPFVYEMAGKPKSMNYWRLPPSAFDDADELKAWGRLAMAAAREAALAKAPKGSRAKAPAKRRRAPP